jgi:hypothetical protein
VFAIDTRRTTWRGSSDLQLPFSSRNMTKKASPCAVAWPAGMTTTWRKSLAYQSLSMRLPWGVERLCLFHEDRIGVNLCRKPLSVT